MRTLKDILKEIKDADEVHVMIWLEGSRVESVKISKASAVQIAKTHDRFCRETDKYTKDRWVTVDSYKYSGVKQKIFWIGR